MANQWIINRPSQEQMKLQLRLTDQLKIDPVIAQLLVQRGINTPEDADVFFRPKLQNLHDPFLMKDMDKAINRLNEAIGNQEKILIYGDYDVDGTTAVALVYKTLSHYTRNIMYYIPDRYNEGYGISMQSIEYARNNGYTLIIALDCGIKANDQIDIAKNYGIDFIICDHHTPGEILPQAIAVLDSKRNDDNYPYKDLSGCGVGFKLMQAFIQNNMLDFKHLKACLDLVVVAIASDIVPITGENRTLAYYGLKQLNSEPSPGMRGILKMCELEDKAIVMNDIIFKIGPRINASGRMYSGEEVVALLTTNNPEETIELSSRIENYNSERRELDLSTTEEAKQLLMQQEDMDSKLTIVMYNDQWHKGIIGIVASRLAEEFHKPTVVITQASEKGLLSGSARSVQGFDIYAAIDSCRDLLDNFGGHPFAAGLALKEENLEEFIDRFEAFVAKTITPAQLKPQIEADAAIEFAHLNAKFMKTLKKFQPFGPGNPNPIFITHNVIDHDQQSKLVGKDHDHIKLVIKDDPKGTPVDAIAFGMKEFHQLLKQGVKLDICYTIEENMFLTAKKYEYIITHHSGSEKPKLEDITPIMQLIVKDIRPTPMQYLKE